MSEIQTRVLAVVSETIESSTGNEVELTAETALIDEGYLDSLTVLQLFVNLQEAFEIELDMDDVTEEAFGTPKSIADLIEERV